ncbi:isopenicillin N synthase family dioxygenase [Lacibacterium aquatile]|uniref:2-oxoglutarate-dependent ethylene/succinate-forming enzyme n=1 Tax=Lacibacterium aquatile TaxID=1168082 RepID=A0ABW5DMA9_9PROT
MPLESPTTTLPILSLAADRESFLADLRRAAREVGFFYLVDHGVDAGLIERLFGLSRQFFDLPDADKLAIEMVNSPHFRGYTRVGWERTRGAADWREQIDIAAERPAPPPGGPAWSILEGPNQWPQALPDLKPDVLRLQADLTALAIKLLGLFAVALGEREDFFEPIYRGAPDQLIKLIRYPGRDVAATDQGVGAHKDSGLLTFVLQHQRGGLQVEGADGWIDATPVPGALVVNIGETLEMASDGYLRANVHKVVAPPPGTDRLSIAFFLGARLDSTVPLLNLPPELAAEAKGPERDPDNPLFREVGRNRLKGRLRSHPDVTERHHAALAAKFGIKAGQAGGYG